MTLDSVRRLHSVIKPILWFGLAFEVAVVIMMIHDAPALHAQAEQQLRSELAEESRVFCEHRGLPVGTHAHLLCVMDLDAIRTRQTERLGSMASLP